MLNRQMMLLLFLQPLEIAAIAAAPFPPRMKHRLPDATSCAGAA